jgi:hypothetical protein
MNPQTIIAWTLTICLAYFLLILCCAFERYINACFEHRKTGKNFEKAAARTGAPSSKLRESCVLNTGPFR